MIKLTFWFPFIIIIPIIIIVINIIIIIIILFIVLDNDGWLNINFYEGEHEGGVKKAFRTLPLGTTSGAGVSISTNSINWVVLRTVFTARYELRL